MRKVKPWSWRRGLLRGAAAATIMALDVQAARADPCPAEFHGAWSGTLPVTAVLQLKLSISQDSTGGYRAELSSRDRSEALPVWLDATFLNVQSARFPVAFRGRRVHATGPIAGFLTHGASLDRLVMPAKGPNGDRWETEWSPLGLLLETTRLDFYIVDEGGGRTGGYFFFRDQRLPGLWGHGMACYGDGFEVAERSLGLQFAVTRVRDERGLESLEAQVLGPAGSAPMTFERLEAADTPGRADAPDRPARTAGETLSAHDPPPDLADGWSTAAPSDAGLDNARLGAMVDAIVTGELDLTHSVLVAVGGRLVAEAYFYGFGHGTWHDLRSASKTLTSTLVGLAIQDEHIEGVDAIALEFFPEYRRYRNWDARKAMITVGDLLAMSSGLDANDSDPESFAAEGAYQSQTAQPDWARFALDAPMIDDPGAQPLYGSANPLILGAILQRALPEPVEWFAHRRLFAPLGIERYRIALDPTGRPYMGGGVYLRPRDMLKFGQMYLDGGRWQGAQIVPREWVVESWKNRGRLAPLERNGNRYGFLWWQQDYPVGDRVVTAQEARGFGGQYISVVPEMELVVAITSGNYRTGKTRQPQDIIERFILPAVGGAR